MFLKTNINDVTELAENGYIKISKKILYLYAPILCVQGNIKAIKLQKTVSCMFFMKSQKFLLAFGQT